MLKINFYPDSDREDRLKTTEKGVKEYKKIWKQEGEKIVKTIEKVSGLKFKEKTINSVVYVGSLPSRSIPLSLKADYSLERKKGILIHELCHRLMSGNKIWFDIKKRNFSLEVHKAIYLILYDIWLNLYGKNFAKANLDYESKSALYKKAWEWALSFNKEERSKRFRKIIPVLTN